jgi:hypothetical protein
VIPISSASTLAISCLTSRRALLGGVRRNINGMEYTQATSSFTTVLPHPRWCKFQAHTLRRVKGGDTHHAYPDMQALLDADSGTIQWVLEYLRALRSGRLRPYSYVESKARLATRGSTTWGPTGEQLRELAAASHSDDDCLDAIFCVLELRLHAQGRPTSWRKVYKALLVLEFLVTRGSQTAARRGRALLPQVQELSAFQYTDPASGRDEGVNVRERAKKVAALLADDARLRQEREMQRKQYWCVSRQACDALFHPHCGSLTCGFLPSQGGVLVRNEAGAVVSRC